MKKILVIDDEPSITEIITLYAGRIGYASDCAGSGREAVELLKKNSYWAVFCDLLMPGMSGIELYEKIRELNNSGLAERFVLLTGTVLDEKTDAEALRKKIIVFQKPFNYESIKDTFNKLESRKAA